MSEDLTHTCDYCHLQNQDASTIRTALGVMQNGLNRIMPIFLEHG